MQNVEPHCFKAKCSDLSHVGRDYLRFQIDFSCVGSDCLRFQIDYLKSNKSWKS